jgi:hypothetical protein
MNYLENLMKEARDYKQARNKRSENSYKGSTYPPNDMAQGGQGREYYRSQANASRRYEDEQFGQMIGALVKGRSYDNATGKQITNKTTRKVTKMKRDK